MFKELKHNDFDGIVNDLIGRNAGIFITGASGSGKTETQHALAVRIARQGFGLTYSTPHEPDAEKFRERMLAQPPAVRQRFVEIEPSNPKRRVKLHPSKIQPHSDRGVFGGRLANKVDHTARILLSSSGETDFDGAPRKFAWMYRVLTEAVRLGLPLSEAPHLIEPSSPLFARLIEAVPHLRNRLAFEHLAGLSPTRQEELIEAVRNRFVRLFANELVEDMLSSTTGTYDAGQMIHQNRIVLLNLNPGENALRNPEDVSLIANLFLAEIFHHIFCSGTITPHWLLLDELPLYKASFPELIKVIPQIRKFQTPIVTAAQGTFAFPDASEDRLFNALIAQCGIHVIMGHNHPADCEFFAKLVGLSSFDPMREKHRIIQEQQYQDGHDLVHLTDYSYAKRTQESHGGGSAVTRTEAESWNVTDGFGTSNGTTQAHANSDSITRSEHPNRSDRYELVQEAVGRAATNSIGKNQSNSQSHASAKGGSKGRSEQESSNWTVGVAHQNTTNIKSQLVPILRWREVISSIAYFSPEEHFLTIAGIISGLSAGQALVRVAGRGTFSVQFEMAINLLARTPKSRARALADFDERLQELDIFYDPATIHEQRQLFLQNLIEELDQLAVVQADEPLVIQNQLTGPRSQTLMLPHKTFQYGALFEQQEKPHVARTSDDHLL